MQEEESALALVFSLRQGKWLADGRGECSELQVIGE